MTDAVILGGGPCGLAAAMLLGQQGLEVLVLDREQAPPGDPDAAWGKWERRSVAQFRQVHYLQPQGRALIEEHLPAVFARGDARLT